MYEKVVSFGESSSMVLFLHASQLDKLRGSSSCIASRRIIVGLMMMMMMTVASAAVSASQTRRALAPDRSSQGQDAGHDTQAGRACRHPNQFDGQQCGHHELTASRHDGLECVLDSLSDRSGERNVDRKEREIGGGIHHVLAFNDEDSIPVQPQTGFAAVG